MGPVVWWWRWWLGMDPNRDNDGGRPAADAMATARQAGGGDDGPASGGVRTLDDAQGEVDRLRSQVADLDQARDEAAELRQRVIELTKTSADADKLRAELDQARAAAAELTTRVAELESTQRESTQPEDSSPPDLAEAKVVLGTSIKMDDLTVVEGVGPKIAGLLADAGVDTWRGLATTDVDRLRAILDDAGSRYRMHDPSPWPPQASLLADGRWQEFKDRKQA